jgi:putative sterol carrier protein
MVKYLTEEWAQQAKKKVLGELDRKKDLKNMNAKILNVVQNVPPDNKTIYYYIKFVDGNLEELLAGPDESIKQKEVEFSVLGDYVTFVQIGKGEMSSGMALLKSRVKLTGNKMKALTITKPLDTYTACIKNIETEY